MGYLDNTGLEHLWAKIKERLSAKQDALVSGTNIKTVNGESLLGDGNITISGGGLPHVASTHNGMVLMVVNGEWKVRPLPRATTGEYGVVMADGDTIAVADGVISVAGSVEAYNVTLTLTNPANPSEFTSCNVWQQETADLFPEVQESLGTITSPTGSATFAVSMPYIHVTYRGMSVALGTATCTGGVSLVTESGAEQIFKVTGDGTIVSDGVDYDD